MNHHFTPTALNLWKAENTAPGAKTGWFCTGGRGKHGARCKNGVVLHRRTGKARCQVQKRGGFAPEGGGNAVLGAKTGWFCTGAEKDTTGMGAVKSNE